MKVALVIGHKSTKPGACNDYYDVCEYEFNKHLTALVEDYINENSVEIDTKRFYRKCNYSDLPDTLNKYDFDLIVSFHANAFNKKSSGTCTLFYGKSSKGMICADLFQRNMVKTLCIRDRGLIPVLNGDRGSLLLRKTKAVAVIIEPFFIDNNKDYILANSNINVLSASIGDAVIKCKNIVLEGN